MEIKDITREEMVRIFGDITSKEANAKEEEARKIMQKHGLSKNEFLRVVFYAKASEKTDMRKEIEHFIQEPRSLERAAKRWFPEMDDEQLQWKLDEAEKLMKEYHMEEETFIVMADEPEKTASCEIGTALKNFRKSR